MSGHCIMYVITAIRKGLEMSEDWNFEPDDDECEICIEKELEECICDEDDWEVYDDGDIDDI